MAATDGDTKYGTMDGPLMAATTGPLELSNASGVITCLGRPYMATITGPRQFVAAINGPPRPVIVLA